jgi:6,7-dimethyl-8-ribityllumazine synthase
VGHLIHIVSTYIHKEHSESMIDAARAVEQELDLAIGIITWVPGTLEVPFAVRELMERTDADGIVVFGVQALGKTKHGEVIAHQVTGALISLQLQYRLPMAIAIIGPCAPLEYAAQKAAPTAQKAMRAVAHMIQLKEQFDKLSPGRTA